MQGRGRGRVEEFSQNNEAIKNANRSDVSSASWLKIALFSIPVIVVVVGVIWASSLE